MKILLIGGTGTLGKEIVPILLMNPQIERIRILSRNEHVQAELEAKWNEPKIDFFVGDVRDRERIDRAVDGCGQVYHLAASKRVESCEYNPEEAVKTNVFGTMNVIGAIRNHSSVSSAMFISSDKAVEPLNVYGTSKALAEKLWVQGNIGSHPRARFSACRYGNVIGSAGSVITTWKKQKDQGTKISVVKGEMTRFFITPSQAARFVVDSIDRVNYGGEIFIPKMKSAIIKDLATVFGGDMKWISPRPGEKIHEKLIADAEAHLTTDCGRYFIRWPEYNLFPVQKKGDPITGSFTSRDAEKFTTEELQELCREI